MKDSAGERIARETVLSIERLSVSIGGVALLDGLDLSVARGEFLALVGESGSGKTIASLAVTRQLPGRAIATGRILVDGTDVASLDRRGLARLRGGAVGMVFQNPLAALNPSHTIGAQIVEGIRIHQDLTRAQARARALDLLHEVGIPEPATRIDDHPHRFSGGQRQRVMIAIALASGPGLLIADEPTTGLDPLVARQIIALLARLREEHRMGVLFVTHDFSVVRTAADRVHVLYAGRTVETGPAAALLAAPHHPYSAALLGAVPRLGADRLVEIPGTMPEPGRRPAGCRFAPRCDRATPECTSAMPPLAPVGDTLAACFHPVTTPAAAAAPARTPDTATPADHAPDRQPAQEPAPQPARKPALLALRDVGVRYPGRPAPTLHDIDLSLARGECLGIVGESGSGKSTLGRAILQMLAYDGEITLDGTSLGALAGRARREARRRIQVVFQDPRESLNPGMRIDEIVTEPLSLAGTLRGRGARRARAEALLARVGLPASLAARLPAAVSGGQAQRIAIARALAAGPEVIVLDEPTSSLDVSTQATLLNLLKSLGQREGLSYVLISHDLAAVSFLADRIAVLRDGAIVELQPTAALIASPRDAYTRALLETVA